MPNVCKYKEVVKRLKNYDDKFKIMIKRGKGSERMISHPNINGRKTSYPIKYHGDKTEIRKGMLKSIIRRFSLPLDIFYNH